MKDDTDMRDTYDPLIAAANAMQYRAGLAVEIASAAASLQIVIQAVPAPPAQQDAPA